MAFLKELSERDDITNASLEEKFNDFGFSMQSSKLLKRPKKSRENASCSKRNSRPTIIHNRLESLKREEIHNVGALRATTHEHFAPYNRKMLVKVGF